MMRKVICSITALLLFFIGLYGFATFKLVEKWTPEGEINGLAAPRVVDRDGHIVGAFYKTGSRIITPKEVAVFAPHGQGPSDLAGYRGICDYNGDIAVVERSNKIKVFSKKNEKYAWKETIWLKKDANFHVVQDVFFHSDKWFLAGIHHLAFKKKDIPYALVTVYEKQGKFLKFLVKGVTDGKNKFYLMDYFFAGDEKQLFFMAENKLHVDVISPGEPKVTKSVSLEVPSFYKKMPEDFYAFDENNRGGNQYFRDIENWKTNYSRITKALVEGKYLVVQVRTCSDRLKKFALLFYNKNTLKLEDTVFIDDYLLGARGGKYYFFQNGDPGIDEGTDNTVISIYKRF